MAAGHYYQFIFLLLFVINQHIIFVYEILGKLIVGINNVIEGQGHIERSRSTGIKRQGY